MSYEVYMRFDQPVQNPEANPWNAQVLEAYLACLDAAAPIVTDAEARGLRACYDNPPRSYHGTPHGEGMGQPYVPEPLAELLSRTTKKEAEALSAIAGLFHDVVYKHVDADDAGDGYWPDLVRQLIGEVVHVTPSTEDGKTIFRTHLAEGKDDDVANMVAHIFDVKKDGIIHNQGGNEFDSALAAAKFLEAKGVPAKFIIAVTAMIAATVPFKPAKEVDASGMVVGDGHMGQLAERVKTATLGRGEDAYQPDWFDVNDMMLLSVNLANRDIAPFILYDNFGAVISNGRKVKQEEIKELRKGVRTIRQLTRAAGRERSAPLLYEWLGGGNGPLSAANVPHFYIMRNADGTRRDPSTNAYPPLPVYEEAVRHAETNSRLGSTYLEAHEASIALVNSIATIIGEPDAEVPGFVHSETVSATLQPQGRQYGALITEEIMLVNIMIKGTGQERLDSATPSRSPFAGVLLGALGSQGIASLAERVKEIRHAAREHELADPFCDPDIAQAFAVEVLGRIGPGNFWTIVHELKNVATEYAQNTERATRLGSLVLAA